MTHNEPLDATASTSLELQSARQCWIAQKRESQTYVDQAASLLHEQWPRGGSMVDYKCKLLGVDRTTVRSSISSSSISSSSRFGDIDIQYNAECSNVVSLPCSYLLIDTSAGQLVGHGRLTECLVGAGGKATAATYIITQPQQMGYGRILMTLLEQEAIRLGYHYMYLWTTTAIPFYHKLHYTRTERISLNSACLKTLETQQVGVLEAMLAKRSPATSTTATSSIRKETVTLPPDAVTENDVWLRKRLVECVASVTIPLETRMDEIRTAIQRQYAPSAGGGGCHWEYYFHHIPWQQQIGPSCGLAALRMLREYYDSSSSNNDNGSNNKPLPSLLDEARAQGYSTDGELFNIHHVVQLAQYCGLQNVRVQPSFGAMSCRDVWNVISSGGGTMIVPYDSQPVTKLPCCTGGRNAHYGIVVGMVFGYRHSTFDSEDSNDSNGEPISTTPPVTEITNADRVRLDDATDVLLLVQHGLSRTWSIAPWYDFVTSNGQLKTIDTTKCCHVPADTTMHLHDRVIVCHG